jgi:hypothetical protein
MCPTMPCFPPSLVALEEKVEGALYRVVLLSLDGFVHWRGGCFLTLYPRRSALVT